MNINNNFSYYNSDGKCYTDMSSIDDKFNTYSYNIYSNSDTVNILTECENKALESNSKMYMVSNARKSGNNLSYNCYIPKSQYIGDCPNTFKDIFRPLNELINVVFGSENRDSEEINSYNTDISLANILQRNYNTDVSNCFSIKDVDSNKSSVFSKNKYVIYKTELIDNNNFSSLRNSIKSHYYYSNENYLGITGDRSTWNTYIFDGTGSTGIITSIENKFARWICSTGNERELDDEIEKLKTTYADANNSINSIIRDISYVEYTIEYDKLYLEELEKLINISKQDLNNLLGLDGANNGKLEDTLYLKNLKVSENIILLLIIFITIFICSKKLI